MIIFFILFINFNDGRRSAMALINLVWKCHAFRGGAGGLYDDASPLVAYSADSPGHGFEWGCIFSVLRPPGVIKSHMTLAAPA